MSPATSTFNDKVAPISHTSGEGQSCHFTARWVCGYSSVSLIMLNTENISKSAKMASPLYQRLLSQKSPHNADTMRGKMLSKLKLQGMDSFQSKVTQEARQSVN